MEGEGKNIAAPEARVTGHPVPPGQALLALAPRKMWVTTDFKETQLTHKQAGQPAGLSADAYPNREFKGKVVQRVPVKLVFDDGGQDRKEVL